MSHPLTLVLTASPGSGAVTDTLPQGALGAINDTEITTRWLSAGDAWEASLDATAADAVGLRDTISAVVGSAPVDINVISGEPATRRKRLLCADMESTIIEQELIDEMADLAGCRAEIAAITAAAMRGELDFEASLAQRVALFAGVEAHLLEGILERVTLMPGAETLVATMRDHGAWTALISGGFTIFAERIAARLGFHAVHANVLEIEGGRLTGRVRDPILGPEGKAEVLNRLAVEGGLALSETLAVGDGANDRGMLAVAGLGVAFRAKPVLAEQALLSAQGAVVTHGDLTALLYLQGYERSQFAAG